VATRDEKVAPEIGHGDVFDAKPVYAIHTQQHALRLVALGIDSTQQIGDPADRQLQAGARVHPGHGQHARPVTQALGHRLHDLVFRDRLELPIERDLTERRAAALGRQTQ
jgi:hypothetical protein